MRKTILAALLIGSAAFAAAPSSQPTSRPAGRAKIDPDKVTVFYWSNSIFHGSRSCIKLQRELRGSVIKNQKAHQTYLAEAAKTRKPCTCVPLAWRIAADGLYGSDRTQEISLVRVGSAGDVTQGEIEQIIGPHEMLVSRKRFWFTDSGRPAGSDFEYFVLRGPSTAGRVDGQDVGTYRNCRIAGTVRSSMGTVFVVEQQNPSTSPSQ